MHATTSSRNACVCAMQRFPRPQTPPSPQCPLFRSGRGQAHPGVQMRSSETLQRSRNTRARPTSDCSTRRTLIPMPASHSNAHLSRTDSTDSAELRSLQSSLHSVKDDTAVEFQKNVFKKVSVFQSLVTSVQLCSYAEFVLISMSSRMTARSQRKGSPCLLYCTSKS